MTEKAAAAKKPRAKADHPTFAVMIAAAITAMKERKGSSRQAIEKYICANYKVGPKYAGPLKQALKKGVEAGSLVQTKGVGASGSFKVAKPEAPAKPAAKKAPAAKKPAAKKAPAKKAPAKKAASPKKPAKKTTAKKTPAKKPAAKKAPAKKAPAKKIPAKKAPAKKAGKVTKKVAKKPAKKAKK